MVEFALTLPLLLFFFALVFDAGYSARIAASTAASARAGAQYALLNPPPLPMKSKGTAALQDGIKQAVQADAGPANTVLVESKTSCSCFPNASDTCGFGGTCVSSTDRALYYITVSVTTSYHMFWPLPAFSDKNGISTDKESATLEIPG